MMKMLALLIVVAAFSYTWAKPQANPSDSQSTPSRGCIYVNGRCFKECEEGTHAYATGCGHMTPEATCDNPNPEEDKNIICDYSACYCDKGTVRDANSNKCVPIDQCPQQ